MIKRKIGYLGTGVWGYCLASMLAEKGHEVTAWSIEGKLIDHLQKKKKHPKLENSSVPKNLSFTKDLKEALENKDLIVEGITSAGIRQVFQHIADLQVPNCPIILTSKGIEQNTGLLLSEVALEVLGQEHKYKIGCLSGPSIAQEVLLRHPTSVVCSAYDPKVMSLIHEIFSTPTFRVYPNADINGVELGGALKNIIAIACGISDGLGFGDNAKAALMTRGLHEIRKLAVTKGCNPDTLNGLAGMGDLCVTCLSTMSRNYQFGHLIAKGRSIDEAKADIGMVVEGAYSCLSAMQIAKKHNLDLPILEAVFCVLYEGISPQQGVELLLERTTQEEHL